MPGNPGWEIGRSPVPFAPRGPRAPRLASGETRAGLYWDQSPAPASSPPCLHFPACGPRAPLPDCFPSAVTRVAGPRPSALALQGSSLLQGPPPLKKILLRISGPGSRPGASPSAEALRPSWTGASLTSPEPAAWPGARPSARAPVLPLKIEGSSGLEGPLEPESTVSASLCPGGILPVREGRSPPATTLGAAGPARCRRGRPG